MRGRGEGGRRVWNRNKKRQGQVRWCRRCVCREIGYDEKQRSVPVGYLVAKIGVAVGDADTDRKWTLIFVVGLLLSLSMIALVDVGLMDIDADVLLEG